MFNCLRFGFDEEMGCFVGVKAEGGELAFVGVGEVFKFIDDTKGAIDQEGGRAEVKGDPCLIHIIFCFSDGYKVFCWFIADDVGEEACFWILPEKLVDKFLRFGVFDEDEERFLFFEVGKCRLTNAFDFRA